MEMGYYDVFEEEGNPHVRMGMEITSIINGIHNTLEDARNQLVNPTRWAVSAKSPHLVNQLSAGGNKGGQRVHKSDELDSSTRKAKKVLVISNAVKKAIYASHENNQSYPDDWVSTYPTQPISLKEYRTMVEAVSSGSSLSALDDRNQHIH